MARRTATRALGTPDVESRILFAPRSYQRAVQEAWRAGCKRLVTVWHRRAGKDVTWLAVTLEALLKRPGLYFHVFPTFAQGRDALWIASSEGKRHLDLFPRELVTSVNETEMQIRFANGAIWQVMGGDQPDSMRGTNPYGIVYSEYPEMPDEAWSVLSPVLAENGGWAAFAYTPKGRNHGHALYQRALDDPTWFVSRLGIDATRRDGRDESGEEVITAAAVEQERRDGHPEEFIQQEFYVSFDASLVGSYYGDQLRLAESEGRITRVPWHPTVPVTTGWDLGFDDYTAIWIVQPVGRELRVLEYLEGEGEHIPYYAKILKQAEYAYGEHLLPHDAEADNIRAELTIEQQLRSLGVRPTRIVPRGDVNHGIQAVRALFPRLVFDEQKTRLGRDRLAAYRKQRDKSTQTYRAKPFHDQASDAADALRTLAVGLHERSDLPRPQYARSSTTDVFGDARGMPRYAQSGTAAW